MSGFRLVGGKYERIAPKGMRAVNAADTVIRQEYEGARTDAGADDWSLDDASDLVADRLGLDPAHVRKVLSPYYPMSER